MRTVNANEHDKHLREDVIRQLEWDPRVKAKNISVAVADKVVTLTGFVNTYAEKYAAEKTAEGVYGVSAIANDLEVKPVTMRIDSDIAHEILEAMRLDVTVPDDRLKVIVAEGLVTLEGAVEWDFQRKGAESCARKIAGVRGVSNHIAVKPKISATEVSSKIEQALRRSAELDARRISVAAMDSKVHLYGSVRSAFERAEAERAAWAAPGVAEVVDHIQVVP